MEECPICGTWTLVYYPTTEHHVCFICGHKHYEKYEDYLKRIDCSKDLILKGKTSITFTVKRWKRYRTKENPCCESGKTWLGCKLTQLRGKCAYGYRW